MKDVLDDDAGVIAKEAAKNSERNTISSSEDCHHQTILQGKWYYLPIFRVTEAVVGRKCSPNIGSHSDRGQDWIDISRLARLN